MKQLGVIFLVRWGCALIYDILILLTLFLFYTLICLWFRHGHAIEPGTLWYQITLLAIFYGYYFFSYRYGGQTIGLKVWKIKLISTRERVSAGQVFLRLLVFIPSMILSICLFKRLNPLTETLTGTRLVQLENA
ncbi:RDD family protein [Legionella yabuuchiae]|uniref:RDD family protein n=1 Tax=Legionella yabuuchiae TaxID=376727 RepID=UPI0010566C06|nr:RDD family protein [Legionella yabuuchiae]